MDSNALGLLIAQARQERGLTQAAAAELAGISRAYLTQIENGRRTPSDATAQKLLVAVGVSMEDLLDQLRGVVPDQEIDALSQVTRGYDALTKFLTPDELGEVVGTLGEFSDLDAAFRVLSNEAPAPGPEGWSRLSKEDRRLVQRMVNRLLAGPKAKGEPK